eukprot:710157_1
MRFILLLSFVITRALAWSIRTGGEHVCVFTSGNETICWGRNNYGQLGRETTDQIGDEANEMGDNLMAVDLGSNFVPMQMIIGKGGRHNCVLSTTNKIKCWGLGISGQLGYERNGDKGAFASTMGDNLPEVDVAPSYLGWIPTHIAGGMSHTCALSATNALKCWGNNAQGQLGQGDTDNKGSTLYTMGVSLKETDLGSNFVPKQIVGGWGHTCALSKNHTVKCFGYNYYGQLGYQDTEYRGREPNQMGNYLLEVDLGSNFIPLKIVAGGSHVCALSITNTVKCWGKNEYGMLGLGDTNHRGNGREWTGSSWLPSTNEMGNNLSEIDLGTNFVPTQVDCGWEHTCALSTSHEVKCWGRNHFGQLGLGDANNRGDTNDTMGDNLLVVDLGSNFTPLQISLGSHFTCALSTTNKVKCWGNNQYGQLGLGDMDHRGDDANEMGDHLPEVDLGSFGMVFTVDPTTGPTEDPTLTPSKYPTTIPTGYPTTPPTADPTVDPSSNPSANPTENPSSHPSSIPSGNPSSNPSSNPSHPSSDPTENPSSNPSTNPSSNPSSNPTENPSSHPSSIPSGNPSSNPSSNPSHPSSDPTENPSSNPSTNPSSNPSSNPTENPSSHPSSNPSSNPSSKPFFLSLSTTDVDPVFLSTWLDDSTSSKKTKQLPSDAVISAVAIIAIMLFIILFCLYRSAQKKKRMIANTDAGHMVAGIQPVPGSDINKWTIDEVYGYFSVVHDGALMEIAKIFKAERVRGSALAGITNENLVEMGVALGDRLEFIAIRNDLVKQCEDQQKQGVEMDNTVGVAVPQTTKGIVESKTRPNEGEGFTAKGDNIEGNSTKVTQTGMMAMGAV